MCVCVCYDLSLTEIRRSPIPLCGEREGRGGWWGRVLENIKC